MKHTLALALAAVCCAFVFSAGTVRADEGWTIERFHADIAVQRDGSLQIVEAIDADFGAQQKHGIFRDIPVRYDYDQDRDRIYQLDVQSVTDASGTPWHYERSTKGANIELKIGDANRTVSGKQTYRIAYRVRGALNAFADHDELFWNVNGADWPVRTLEASATVTLEGGGLTDTRCFEGPTGSKEACNVVKSDDRAGYVSARGFSAGEQLTIVTAIRKGVVAEPTPILQDSRFASHEKGFSSAFRVTTGTILAAGLLMLVGLAFVVVNWWRGGRDRIYKSIYYLSDDPAEETRPLWHRDQVVVEYTPPESLRPAEMGLLLDEHVDNKDVTATIISMAVQGYLSITEIPKTGRLSKADYRLTKKKEARDLKAFERTLFKGLMGDRKEVLLSDLHADYWSALREAQDMLYADAAQHRWFVQHPANVRSRWMSVGVGILLASAPCLFALAYVGAGVVALPIALTGLLIVITSRLAPKRTAKGSELMRRVLGFRLYVSTAERDRQKFNEQKHIFAQYLPFAIVFGCVEKWARVFDDVDVAQVTRGWYSGANLIGVAALSQSLQGFSGSIASTIGPPPIDTPGGHGLSGFSGGGGFGGGFSGGGGGGGGGGSW
jgi:uncharacterized membrane protein YgcG